MMNIEDFRLVAKVLFYGYREKALLREKEFVSEIERQKLRLSKLRESLLVLEDTFHSSSFTKTEHCNGVGCFVSEMYGWCDHDFESIYTSILKVTHLSPSKEDKEIVITKSGKISDLLKEEKISLCDLVSIQTGWDINTTEVLPQ
jgi:hypothetical protein